MGRSLLAIVALVAWGVFGVPIAAPAHAKTGDDGTCLWTDSVNGASYWYYEGYYGFAWTRETRGEVVGAPRSAVNEDTIEVGGQRRWRRCISAPAGEIQQPASRAAGYLQALSELHDEVGHRDSRADSELLALVQRIVGLHFTSRRSFDEWYQKNCDHLRWDATHERLVVVVSQR
jgi:hypothetical protein